VAQFGRDWKVEEAASPPIVDEDGLGLLDDVGMSRELTLGQDEGSINATMLTGLVGPLRHDLCRGICGHSIQTPQQDVALAVQDSRLAIGHATPRFDAWRPVGSWDYPSTRMGGKQ